MFLKSIRTPLIAAVLGLASSCWTQAGTIDTIKFSPDNTRDGLGTGTLAGGTIAVGYTTVTGLIAGDSYDLNDASSGLTWSTSLATGKAAGSEATNRTGGATGAFAGVPQLQTISFSANVTNPILYVIFTGPESSFNFGTSSVTLLGGNNALLKGNVVTLVGSTNTFNDGFAIQFNGVYGPANSIAYTQTSPKNQTQTFTIGIAPRAIPQPAAPLLAVAAEPTFDTIDFSPDTDADGLGTGTLAGGAITVGYSTHSDFAGAPLALDWTTSQGTDKAVGSGVTHKSGGGIGAAAGVPQVQTISFSADVTNPILFVGWTDPDGSFNFGANGVTLLQSNHAQLKGNVVTFAGASGTSPADGFAIQLNGVYGPSKSIQYTETSPTSQTQTFTIGIAPRAKR